MMSICSYCEWCHRELNECELGYYCDNCLYDEQVPLEYTEEENKAYFEAHPVPLLERKCCDINNEDLNVSIPKLERQTNVPAGIIIPVLDFSLVCLNEEEINSDKMDDCSFPMLNMIRQTNGQVYDGPSLFDLLEDEIQILYE